MNNPAYDIRDLLVNTDGVTTPIYISKMPAEVDELIMLSNRGGDDPSPKYMLNFPGLQVISRANTYVDAFTNAQEIFEKLLGRPSFTINNTKYSGIVAQSTPQDLKVDEMDRTYVFFNLLLITEPEESNDQYRLQLS